MNVSLTPELEQFVQAKLDSGMYHSASEVIREGLRLLKERDQFQEMKLAALREEILKGLQQAEQGLFSDLSFDDIKAEGRRRLLDQQQAAQ
jgi:antitoxin ParD1/3/4